MILFLFVSVIYIGILLFLKPAPNNLKSPPLTGVQNIKAIKASLFLGILISTIFFFTSNFTFIDTNEAFYQYLALNNNPDLSHLWPIQLITHLFIHVNFIHIICNVCGCGLVSVYERRVGTKRFLIVLSVASLTSIPSILFYQEPIAISGISGGIFGLAAAYFTDHKDLTIKEWLYAIIFFIIIIIMVSLKDDLNSHKNNAIQFQIDHIGHALGAVSAIVYCRMTSKKLNNFINSDRKRSAV